jgi:hypothetical protein
MMSTKQVQQIFLKTFSNNTHAPFNLTVFGAMVSQQTAIIELLR